MAIPAMEKKKKEKKKKHSGRRDSWWGKGEDFFFPSHEDMYGDLSYSTTHSWPRRL